MSSRDGEGARPIAGKVVVTGACSSEEQRLRSVAVIACAECSARDRQNEPRTLRKVAQLLLLLKLWVAPLSAQEAADTSSDADATGGASSNPDVKQAPQPDTGLPNPTAVTPDDEDVKIEALAKAEAEASRAAQLPQLLKWNPEWREFTWEDWTITGASLGIAVAGQLIPENSQRWRGQFAFDESGRQALRLRGELPSLYARDASDVMVTVAIMYPVLVDALTVAWWHKQSPDVAREIGLLSVETLAVTSALQSTVSGVGGRERPYGRRCGGGGDLSEASTYCTGSNRFRSFFSGHASMSFASAGVVCANHARIPLYGGGFADKLVCALAFVNAGAVGTLRILSDQHYVSDVLVGATVGTLTGLGLPWLLHYRPSADRGFAPKLSLRVVGTPGGLGLGGDF